MNIRERGLGVPWLIRIRWAAVVGQLLVYLAATALVGMHLSPLPIAAISCLVAASNFLLTLSKLQPWLRRGASQGYILVLDVLLLTALLYFYGGYTNPFGMVYLIHVVLAAMLLGRRWTWGISILCSLCYALLFVWHVPVPELNAGHHMADENGSTFNLHLQGMLFGFILIAALISGFLERMRAEIDWREQELARRRSNEEKLAAVTTLSASIAHELGTPLASMMLIIDDIRAAMTAEVPASIPADVNVLGQQLERCAEALRRLVQSSGELFGEVPARFSVSDLCSSLRTHFRTMPGQAIEFGGFTESAELSLPREGLTHVVSALIKNAIEASRENTPVKVSAKIDSKRVSFCVEDRGIGIPATELQRIGEPFFSTKDAGRGMGLGLFISKLFAERLGGIFSIESTVGRGTKVLLELPRSLEWEAAR